MKSQRKRGFPMPTHIIVSGILLLIQLLFITTTIYDYTLASTTAYVLTVILGIITVVVIINRRGNPDHKISWIVFILVFPIFGITVFLLWSGGRVLPSTKKRMSACEIKYKKYLTDCQSVLDNLKYQDLYHSRQAEYLVGESGYPLYNGSTTEYMSPVEDLLPKLIEELKSAEKYIYLQFFILAEGKMWDTIHSVLKE